MLKHWVKTGASGSILPGSNGGDVGGDYAFSKYNKKVDMLAYNDEEYASLVEPIVSDWTRAETDHLFDLLNTFDLRFLVAHDRWGVGVAVASDVEAGKGGDDDKDGDKDDEAANKADDNKPATVVKPRAVEEMKSRYYEIARRLLEARCDVPEEAAAHPIIKDPFNPDAERDRKSALADQVRDSHLPRSASLIAHTRLTLSFLSLRWKGQTRLSARSRTFLTRSRRSNSGEGRRRLR
jgi:DNA methyltransferase 1-associated protein 1